MIFVFHGENQPALRESLLKLGEEYAARRFWEGELEELRAFLATPSLFGKELIILENFSPADLTRFFKGFKNDQKDMALVFPRSLKRNEVDHLPSARVLFFRDDIPRNVFPLLDAIVARDRRKALLAARRITAQGFDIDHLLKMLSWQFRSLTRVKGGALKGVSPYTAGKLKKFAQSWNEGDLRRAFREILREDLRQKKGQKVPFDFLISKLVKR